MYSFLIDINLCARLSAINKPLIKPITFGICPISKYYEAIAWTSLTFQTLMKVGDNKSRLLIVFQNTRWVVW